MLEFEKELKTQNYKLIAGMDEAGRGPLAGPLFTAMVIMPLNDEDIIDGINDSKKLSPKKRLILYEKIKEKAISYKVELINESAIDNINILNADKLGMNNCFKNISIKPDYCLVDFVPHLDLPCPHKEIVKGDSKSYSIACASILAKVERDKYMEEIALKYPEYHFEKHKGYGTKLHYEMINKYGICPIHRKSFLKNLLNL